MRPGHGSVDARLERGARAVRRVLGAVVAHPVVAGVVTTVAGGLILVGLTGSEGADGGNGRATSDAPPSCEPAIHFEGHEDFLPPGAEVVRAPPGTFSGSLEQGDILSVSKTPHGEFVDALTVRPGAVVTVGFWLSNSGPGKVGEVEARVDLPDRADSALELELEVTWSGNAGREKTTDTATIFVSPSESRACARYVPQSTREREGDGPRRASTLDWITSESGAFLDQFGSSLSEIRFVYFNVVVI